MEGWVSWLSLAFFKLVIDRYTMLLCDHLVLFHHPNFFLLEDCPFSMILNCVLLALRQFFELFSFSLDAGYHQVMTISSETRPNAMEVTITSNFYHMPNCGFLTAGQSTLFTKKEIF